MAVSTGYRVTVADTATRIDSATISARTQAVLVRNRGAVSVYLGGAGVTTAAGFQLDAGESVSMDAHVYQLGLYGITAAGTAAVHVLHVAGD